MKKLLWRTYKRKWMANLAVIILDFLYASPNDCYSVTLMPNGTYHIEHDT